MELATFAINDGFSEAILRGLRSSFLTEGQYTQMKNCNNLQELKTFLEETDYQHFLQGQEGEVTIPSLKIKLRQKLAGEFDYIASQSVPPLSDFIHIMSCQYMIDNVINMIEGLKQPEKNNQNNLAALLSNTDPLGYFPEMKNIKILEGEDYAQLYRDVLIDTPVGPYFMQFLEECLAGNQNENRTLNDIQNIFKEMKTINIKTQLKKIWLEDFYAFCENNLPSTTSSEMMIDLLKFEADTKAIQVVYNTLATGEKKSQQQVVTIRKQLIPSIGYLYPDCQKGLQEASNLDTLRESVKGIENYKDILASVNQVPDPQKGDDKAQEEDIFDPSIDDFMYLEEVRKYSLSFDQEQEIRNIVWMAELIQRNQEKQKVAKGFKKIIIPFSASSRQGKMN